MAELGKRALFLDRDGVINIDSGYIWRPEDFIFNDGVFEACRAAQAMDYVLVIVTNQAGIGRGLYAEKDFHTLTDWMLAQFVENDIVIARVYYAPTHPDEGIGVYRRESPDRKPGPGMLFRARDAFGIDMSRSAIIGDRETDIEAGINGGVGYKILIEGAEEDPGSSRADAVVTSLSDAVAWLAVRDAS
ncbi:MAG: HAD family hydrolase [Alphaproteobacteria bacterium]|nr:HAD family hydrolase [Alphaproteobacteria bacterium]